MRFKIALCKTHMIGSPALIFGLCRYDDMDSHWQLMQLFTLEEHLDGKGYPGAAEAAAERSKYHFDTVFFSSIGKQVKVLQCGHDFDITKAEPVEISRDELDPLTGELRSDWWEEFDIETWGK